MARLNGKSDTPQMKKNESNKDKGRQKGKGRIQDCWIERGDGIKEQSACAYKCKYTGST